jgi:hypothetical protein
MDGSDFLTVAREVVRGATEAHWRTAAGRAYFALMLALRDGFVRWGLSVPPHASVHQLTQRRVFTSKDGDMKQIGRWLQRLRDSRVIGDYELTGRPEYASNVEAHRMIRSAADALALFDAIEADTPRRDAIAAEIKAVLP